jgi:MnmE helical domain
MALAHSPPLVGAGRGEGSRGPWRFTPSLACLTGQRDPPPGLPHKGGGAPSTCAAASTGGVAEPDSSALAAAEFAISAKTGAGVDQLLDALAELAEERMSSREPALLTVERHRYAFQDARDALAATLGPDAAEWELIAEDLRRAAAAMDRIVGRIGAEEVLGEIFARLCVGK